MSSLTLDRVFFYASFFAVICILMQCFVFENANTVEKRLAARNSVKGWVIILCGFLIIGILLVIISLVRGL